MRDGVQLGLLGAITLLGRLLTHRSHDLGGLGGGLLVLSMTPARPIRLGGDELLVALGRLARLRCLRTSLLRLVLLASHGASHGRLALGWGLHQALQWVGILVHHALRSASHRMMRLVAFLRPGLLVAALHHILLVGHQISFLSAFLHALLLLAVDLLHLVMLVARHDLFVDHLLAIALLLLLHLLLLQEQDLLNLLLRELLVNHLLLSGEVVLLDLLATAFDIVQLMVVVLLLVFIDVFTIFILFGHLVLLLHLRGLLLQQ